MTNPAGGPPPPGGAPPPPSGGPPPPAPAGGGTPATTPPGAAALPYAEWWKRVVAALIDGVILYVVNIIIAAIFGIGSGADFSVDPTTGEVTGGTGFFARFVVGNLVLLLVGVAYYVALNGSDRGQTVGKMALKIALRDDATGGPAGYGKAFIRYIVGAVLFILCIVPGVIDLLFPLWDPKKQTLHDKAANTVVIDVP